MEKLPTAQELGNKLYQPIGMSCNEFAIKLAIEFAKLHVEAALKEALESIPCLGSSSDIATYEEVEDAVLNSYPLENIK
jgi:hypothetical protein